jgi:hypothetical protein
MLNVSDVTASFRVIATFLIFKTLHITFCISSLCQPVLVPVFVALESSKGNYYYYYYCYYYLRVSDTSVLTHNNT